MHDDLAQGLGKAYRGPFVLPSALLNLSGKNEEKRRQEKTTTSYAKRRSDHAVRHG